MVIVVTGSRTWPDEWWIWRSLDRWRRRALLWGETLRIVQGGADGADTWANQFAEHHGCDRQTYPAEWAKYKRPGKRNRAGPVRNRAMLDAEQPTLVIAFLNTQDDLSKSGTVDCIRAAAVRNLPIELHTV